jgi:hypothetical protein
MSRKAHIVWNADRTEGVIFVDAENFDPSVWPLSAEDDAYQALTGESRRPGIGSALAEAFVECYDDPEERKAQTVDWAVLA